jgi:hypothetical protein
MNVDLKLTALYDALLSKIQAVEAIRGEKGDKGDPGPQGLKGESGKTGKTGQDGKAGQNGKDGKDGLDGIDGEPGIGIEDANVDFDGHLVLKMTNGEEIDAGSVKDINEAQAPNVYNISMGSMASRADLKNATAKIISSNHTTGGSEILKVTSGVIINLREHPQDRETVLVNCRTDDRIDIVGEINIVNLAYYDIAKYNVNEFGYSSIIVEQDDTTLHLVYIQEFKEWLAI